MNLDVWYLNTKAPHKIIALGAHCPDHTLYIFRLIILVSCLNSVSYFLNYVYLIWRHEVEGEVVELGSKVKKFQSWRHGRSWVYSWVLWRVLFLQIQRWAILQQQIPHLQWHIQRWKTHSGRLLFGHGCSSKVCAISKLFIMLFLKNN